MTFRFSPRPNRAAEIGWRDWDEKAFQEAQVADKPILLAISAVWCHWCHVMDETSYSDPEVIRMINDRYVPIRVDNDERPDVNRRYNMGGWPTTAFLTPDGEVVHGGTYVPPEAMRSYLTQVDEVWRTRKADLTQHVAELREKMREDNAELLSVYAQAHRTFPSAGYDRVVRDVIGWMDAVLWRDELELWSGSQDADEHYYVLDANERTKHVAPFVDRTLYTGWNALAVSGYFAAATALGDDRVGDHADRAMRALTKRMWDVDTTSLSHFVAGSGRALTDQLGDLAGYLAALLDAYETGRHPAALAGAVAVATTLRDRLQDREHGGFFDGPSRVEPGRLGVRERPLEENALAADGLLRLAVATGENEWRELAIRTLRSFVGEYRQWGQFAAVYANAVARALAEPIALTVV